MTRPGLTLLESFVAEELRGTPAGALAAADEAARADPSCAAEHHLDMACALLVAGEPRAAGRAIDDAERMGPDAAIGRRIAACRAWADQCDRNWYPGEVGAELFDLPGEMLTIEAQPSDDPETALLEACVAQGPLPLRSSRTLVESFARQRSGALSQILESASGQLGAFFQTAVAADVPSSARWASAARADLLHRATLTGEADALLEMTRDADVEQGDAVGLAATFLLEGDWYAAPGSSPEALGHALGQQSQPSPLEATRDHGRAAVCYDRAAELLAAEDAPRAQGALALRRAALEWARAGFDDQRALLEAADASFATAGDAAGRQLVAVHRLLADLAAGEIASTRLTAATGWDLRARGPIADAVAWATARGSVSFGVGLGRLLQRVGETWQAEHDHDRAAVAYSMALPLLSLGGGVLPATLLDALAAVDLERNFVARALVRLEQAFRALPPARPVGDDPTGWMSQVQLVTSMTQAQSDRAVGSGGLVGLAGLERAIERLRRLTEVPGVPSEDIAGSSLRDAPGLLAEMAAGQEGGGVEQIMSGALAQQLTAMTAQAVRDQIATMTALTQLHRARIAERAGWTAEAERWYAAALASVDAAAPAHRWVGVLVCASWGRRDEARARYDEVRASGALPDDLLSGLAMRVEAYDTAQSLYAALDAGHDGPWPWKDLTDRAELALETGAPTLAQSQAAAAIEGFEATVRTVGRDPDRLALCDDPQVGRLYLVAARAWLAIAEERHSEGDETARDDALARSFEASDRGRSLALSGLVAGAARAAPDDDALRREWQQASTEWSSAFERLLAAYEAHDEIAPRDRHGAPGDALTQADDALIALEADIDSRRPGTLADARALPSPPDAKAVQRALPPGACVLQYQVVARDLIVWSVTADRVQAVHRRLDAPGLEPLVASVWRGCSAGRPGAEADELSELLLAPVADTLRACSRVVVVPFGPLTAVPFHALPFEGAPLGHERALSFLPSASLLAGRHLDAKIEHRDAVAVGDPAFDRDAQPSLPRLPGALLEARSVGRIWGTDDVLVGEDARESELRRLLPGRAIVHLAAHGHLDEIAPSASALVLAGADRLTVSDLIGLRLDADLAVLSACDSGRGKATLGGDVIGLTRGLLAAGVRGAVVSLWPVDDAAASVTMAALHEGLAGGKAPAHALADAHDAIRAMSAAQLQARYVELGGEPGALTQTVRRGGGAAAAASPLPLDPEFLDTDEPGDEPLDSLEGALERVWAPFILVGV